MNPSVQIYVAESDSIGRSLATEKFRFQGYASLFADLSAVHLVDLSHSPVQVYPCAGRFFKDGVVLASTFAEADFFISLAKMKTHSVAVMTGCLKNQFGCLPDMHKDRYHPYLPAVIADVNSAVRPDLCILEACPAMEGNDPVLGDPRDLGIILLGVDPLAIDATAARIMGMQPERILLFVEAEQAAVGTWRPEQIRVTGLTCAEIGGRFKFISREQRLYVIGESCKGRTISGRPQAPLDAKIVRSLSGLSIRFGLAIQWAADRLNGLGHRLHLVQGTGWAIGRIVSKAKKGLTRGASHGAA